MSSRRQYLSRYELIEYANINVTNTTEADDQISKAEEMIDAYVGHQDKAMDDDRYGVATSGTTTTLIDTSSDSPIHAQSYDDYFTYCEIEIIGGTNKGERRTITGFDASASQLTFAAFTSAIDATSAYRIYQLGKFPREQDTRAIDSTYYKWIIEAVKRATAAQVTYIIERGEAYFEGGATDKKSEGLDDYSYTSFDINKMIAPKAREFLRGIRNRTGRIAR